ncbi:hypothetical protein RGF97_32765 [Streptomyces roseicoloratus]|uniref:FAD-binding domain-containing protein n=1 Tax=Streptomyces roseicoloratus TaxID=2508722 RepID=A0ABY9S2Z1_9ACTN|nr:hypothetical protein [Streptomyces roseicoloratus]WMX48617.1 hypothetical protein RGF97_32765 [Streptomyces roseicoloratus]
MKRAVVMGGSYAGLFAARVLSDVADEVVVLEPDDIGADGTGSRAPQRRQLHALLAQGHRQLERWFPGITAELVADGARMGEGGDVRFYVDGRLKAPADGLRMLGAGRPLLESGCAGGSPRCRTYGPCARTPAAWCWTAGGSAA